MTQVRVESFSVSIDGYGAGPNQDRNNPLGVGGEDLHQIARKKKLTKSFPGSRAMTERDYSRKSTRKTI